jgi:AraC family transcriptional regulator, regulatory protein of adaptative response / methylated-DNA-[protein]-cysteine methyltransferase
MSTTAILEFSESNVKHLDDNSYWDAVMARDSSKDGEFVFAVASTGIYCRPSCPAKRPRREGVSFFRKPNDAERAGYRACLRCHPRAMGGDRQTELAKAVCRYMEQHLDETITLPRLTAVFQKSSFYLQRAFKAALGVTPHAYAESLRMERLKQNLRAGHGVTRALYDAGFSSSSRLYSRASPQLGMTPEQYRRGAIAASIHYLCAESPLGRMLIAATDKGICAIQFADTDAELEQGLRREFPFARLQPAKGELIEWKDKLLRHLRGQSPQAGLPLDIQATSFQRRVWEYLQSIPFGESRSYSQVARAIGNPKASRAVARACAANHVAVAIPCHRVVRSDGEMGGYRWGMARKKKLLAMEKSGPGAPVWKRESRKIRSAP